jgi:primary-amine oxidase
MAPVAITPVTGLTADLVPPSKASAPSTGSHPLDELTSNEHEAIVSLVKREYGDALWFKAVQRIEPAKSLLAPYLDAVQQGQTPRALPRKAEVIFTEKKDAQLHVCIVDVSSMRIEKHELIDSSHKPPLDIAMLTSLEQLIISHPATYKALEDLGLAKDVAIAADPWIYGSDEFDDEPSYISFMMHLRPPRLADKGDAFHYAYPLPFVPVVDARTNEVVRIDWMYTGEDADGMRHTWKERFDASIYQENEYMPELQANYKARQDLKPLTVVQPEGASFTVQDREITWQKWSMRLSWNVREGLVLHDVRYDGRPTFYRLSMSEMTVPYGDPRPPLHRKQAFDLGDAGAGITANSLHLGCDCLGLIHYFDGTIALPDGSQLLQKNVVCLHEQDMGIGMKHTNYRTENPFVTRNRQLVLRTIITVANYEYIFSWNFDQAGAIHFETRATGVLSVSAIDGGKVSSYGNVVAPGVLATNHQHIFCLRIQPRIDGDGNTVQYEDSVAMPFETSEDRARNPKGTGYTVVKTVMDKEGYADLDPFRSRTFKIVNNSKINAISQRPHGFKLHIPATQLLLAHPDSVAAHRAPFAQHHVWVTKHLDGQAEDLYAAGKWTNQSRGKAGGVADLAARSQSTVDEDIVVWAVFGLTHNPRVEDFPIMPVETLTVSLKPADFFTRNPAMDVPMSNQRANRSTLHGSSAEQISACCRS